MEVVKSWEQFCRKRTLCGLALSAKFICCPVVFRM